MDNIKELCGDRVLIKKPFTQEVTKGGIYIPKENIDKSENRSNKPWKAEVIMIGDDILERIEKKVKIGTIVYVAPVARDCPKFEIGKEQYLIITSDDIYGIEKEPKNGKK